MAEKNAKPEPHSPERLLAGFSKTPMGHHLFLAISLHILLVLGFSYGYIRGHLDPEWKRERDLKEKARIEAALKGEPEMQVGKAVMEKKARDRAAAENADTNAVATGPEATAAADLNRRIAEAFAKHNVDTNNPVVAEQLAQIPKERWVAPEILESLASARTNEMPRQPDVGLDLSIDDTN